MSTLAAKSRNAIEAVVSSFKSRLLEDTGHIFDLSILSKDCIIAGGYIATATPFSDIDIWLLNCDRESLETRLDCLFQHFHFNSYIGVSKNRILTVVVPGTKRNIQIIPTGCKTAHELIATFDTPYTRCFFDGNLFHYTKECIYALQTRRVILNKEEAKFMTEFQLLRSLMKGFDVFVMEDNAFHSVAHWNSYETKQKVAKYAEENKIDMTKPHQRGNYCALKETKPFLINRLIGVLNKAYFPTVHEIPEVIERGMQQYLGCGQVLHIRDWAHSEVAMELELFTPRSIADYEQYAIISQI